MCSFFFFQLAKHGHFVIACISFKRPLFVSFWFILMSKIKIVFNVFWPRKYCYRVLQLVATESIAMSNSTSCAWCRHNMPHPPVTLTLKMVSKSHVTWATSLPILVFVGLSVLELGPMYATDKTNVRQHHRLMPPPIRGGTIMEITSIHCHYSTTEKVLRWVLRLQYYREI